MQAVFMESLCDLKTRVIILPCLQNSADIYFKHSNASSLPLLSLCKKKPIIFTAEHSNF